jgi:hypothetical protein
MAGKPQGRDVGVPERLSGGSDYRQRLGPSIAAAQEHLVFVADSAEEAVATLFEAGYWLTIKQIAKETGYAIPTLSGVIAKMANVECRNARIDGKGRPVPHYRRKK